ncbi:hypothetical protein [Serratia fonticola]|uniref:hypothetical protein n=1 Tax=Serratia fonticola TaxID=47917 RepID=UPI003AABDCBF|nr:hypothetical protein [Serratia fonticola]HBE9152346.1 hypothetical protein [Serratia fonticola]
MTVFEMQGVLRGKAIPGDMKVNESLAGYLVRKFAERDADNEQLKARLDAVVAECARLLPKAASELSNAWVLNKYWVGINAALMHLEMGRVDVAQEWLRNTIAGPGLDCPELEEVDDIDAWAAHQNRGSISHAQALEIIKAETPATSAALAEVEAKAIEKFAAHLHDQAPHVEECDMESYEVFGHLATEFASTLREAR